MSPCCCEPTSVGEVLLAPGVRPAGAELMRRAGVASELMGLPLLVKSGDRDPHEAWVLRMRYLNGTGNLAARCCWQSGRHSWSACGKQPTSLHSQGRAIDCGFVKDGRYDSFMNWPGALSVATRAGIKAPMWPPWGSSRIEPWHMTLA